jgi:hypothetical protein
MIQGESVDLNGMYAHVLDQVSMIYKMGVFIKADEIQFEIQVK